ncbi:uncharacterized protein [Antedon mediterranea]|uniref:uncharacterized protein isoform X2 n=1 Tax=Antedon mediterranea TaxID=105859 RepID=UPI003AF45F64
MRLWTLFTILIMNCNESLSLQCKENKAMADNIGQRDSHGYDYRDEIENVDYTNHPCYRTCENPAKPKICDYEFTAEWTISMSGYCFDCPLNPDDCKLTNCLTMDGKSRVVAITNGTTPGPSIHVCEGDTIRVKLNNQLQDHGGLTIHWHGLHQVGSNWMDGVSMVTQCPIPHATSFVYEFLADPAGTHWWHGHSGLYRADGIYGSLIIRKPIEKENNWYLYDLDLPEHTILLTEWQLNTGLESYLAQTTSSLPSEFDQTILVNGKSRGRKFLDSDGNVVYTPRSVFHVKPGLRYRFRVISSAIEACNIQISVDGHFIWIVATDGSDVKPIKVDSFIIGSGERYDFVIAASSIPRSYLIRVEGLSVLCNTSSEALLCYRDAPCIDPTPPTHSWQSKSVFSTFPVEHNMFKYRNGISDVLNLFDTHALEMDPDLDYVDSRHYFLFSFFTNTVTNANNGNNFTFSIPKINRVGYSIPETPVLLKMPEKICEPHLNTTLMEECEFSNCYCTNIVKLKLGEVVEFVIANFKSERLSVDHPTHIHGQSTRIVGLGVFNGTPPQSLEEVVQLDKKGNLTRIHAKDAVIKDTVIIPTNGYAIMRWKTTNPGIWFFHCHIETHLEDGMAMVLQVGEEDDIQKPPKDFPTCGSWPKFG